MDKSLRDKWYQDKGLYGTSTVLAHLRAVAADVGQRHEEYQAFFTGWGMSCHIRQLGAVLEIIIDLAALDDVEDFCGTVGQLHSCQNSLVRIMECVTNDTVSLTRNFNKLRGGFAGAIFRGGEDGTDLGGGGCGSSDLQPGQQAFLKIGGVDGGPAVI